MKAYTTRFRAKRRLAVARVLVTGLRKKEHSPHNVYLADKMKLEAIEFEVTQ